MANEQSPPESTVELAACLKAAYAVRSPDDNRQLYAKWAATYDQFLEANRYIAARLVAEIFSERWSPRGGAVLDAGCGTGRVGLELCRLGVAPIDGIDISPEMLARARSLSRPDGESVYRGLIVADLTGAIDLESDSYSGVLSCGAFTHGHLGPEALSELLRVAQPGSAGVIAVNSAIFETQGFGDRFERYAADGVIEGLEVMLCQGWEGADGSEPSHMAQVAAFTVA
ncbi:MAG: class I SAM-dependent methyltransferase [Acidimicrobiaceae bacterium]|nr:class I SAM-dependent methyltransferase [Acidimicrobiaceae bacterium]MYH00688.1 class I SAM-dependent methyltransferase [Acidimicrobiaceae bacterium]MYL05238.1 class I SAM-dependent methyltransferase [Acidimicrobiaceae bacterium]